MAPNSDVSTNTGESVPPRFADAYKRFEDKFRGSAEEIRGRLSAYLPFLDVLLKELPGDNSALDIGCGRGEWLSLIREKGFKTIGVDLDEEMLNVARNKGHNCINKDALSFLKSCPDGHYSLISAFHVVEHVPIDYLVQLLHEIKRVLVPKGCLILETPNPENLRVGLWSFYLDPTHERPIPPPLLHFLVQDSGTSDAFVFRLNGSIAGKSTNYFADTLCRMLDTSPDYSIVALKEPGHGQLEQFQTLIRMNSQSRPDDESRIENAGRELETRLSEIDKNTSSVNSNLVQWNANLNEMRRAIKQQHESVVLVHSLTARNSMLLLGKVELESQLSRANLEVDDLRRQLSNSLVTTSQLDHEVSFYKSHIDELKTSSSWKVTAPFRACMFLASSTLRFVRKILGHSVNETPSQPNDFTTTANELAASAPPSTGETKVDPLPPPKPSRYDDLASVKIMKAADELKWPIEGGSVSFLQVKND
jgi:SAM-dependent methyltransferase